MNSLKVWFAFLFCFFSMVASSHAYIRVSSPSGTITGRSIDVEAEVSSSA